MSGSEEEVYVVKINLVGDRHAGTSSFLHWLSTGTMSPPNGYGAVGAIDFRIARLNRNGKIYKLQIWDSFSNFFNRGLFPAYFRASSVICLCYDVSSLSTFEYLTNFYQLHKSNEQMLSARFMLVGLQSDKQRKVPRGKALEFAKELECELFEVSAATGAGNVNNLTEEMLSIAIEGQVGRQRRKVALDACKTLQRVWVKQQSSNCGIGRLPKDVIRYIIAEHVMRSSAEEEKWDKCVPFGAIERRIKLKKLGPMVAIPTRRERGWCRGFEDFVLIGLAGLGVGVLAFFAYRHFINPLL